MKVRTILLGLMLLSLICAIAVPARAQAGNADFQQAVAAYQQSPSDATAERVIKMAAAMDQLPPIPEEARRHFVRGTALFKDAKSQDDYKQVIDEFLQAVHLAPWWPDARYNLALAQEAAGDYASSISNLKLYLLFKLPEAEARAAQDKIYAIEAKQEKELAAQKAVEDQRAQQRAVEASKEREQEEFLRKISGARYVYRDPKKPWRQEIMDVVGDYLTLATLDSDVGWNLVDGAQWRIDGRSIRLYLEGKSYGGNGCGVTGVISEDGNTITANCGDVYIRER